jgi:hypothetical protein
MKLTAEEAEERLIPYQDTLPVSGMAFTTYNKQVRLRRACSWRWKE